MREAQLLQVEGATRAVLKSHALSAANRKKDKRRARQDVKSQVRRRSAVRSQWLRRRRLGRWPARDGPLSEGSRPLPMLGVQQKLMLPSMTSVVSRQGAVSGSSCSAALSASSAGLSGDPPVSGRPGQALTAGEALLAGELVTSPGRLRGALAAAQSPTMTGSPLERAFDLRSWRPSKPYLSRAGA